MDLHVVQSRGQTSVLACQKRLTQLIGSTGLLTSASPLSHHPFLSLHQRGSVPLATPTPSVFSISLVAPSETCVLRTTEFTSPAWTQDSTCTHPAPPWHPRVVKWKAHQAEDTELGMQLLPIFPHKPTSPPISVNSNSTGPVTQARTPGSPLRLFLWRLTPYPSSSKPCWQHLQNIPRIQHQLAFVLAQNLSWTV